MPGETDNFDLGKLVICKVVWAPNMDFSSGSTFDEGDHTDGLEEYMYPTQNKQSTPMGEAH